MPAPCDLDLLTLKLVFESRMTWATSVPILVFLGLSVLDLGPMYATDVRQTDVRHHHRLTPPPIRGGGTPANPGSPAKWTLKRREISQQTVLIRFG